MLENNTLKLILCDTMILEKAIEGNESLQQYLQVNLAPQWSEFGEVIFKYVLEKIQQDPQSIIWWAYFPIHKADNCLIGTCGYKGKPNEEGVVEIGYEVAKNYRHQGLATEMVKLLIQHAFSHPEVKVVQAHTLAEPNASNHILQKCGFEKISERMDNEDGLVWLWRLKKYNFTL